MSPDTLSQLFTGLAYSALGGLIGFVLGRFTRRELEDHVRHPGDRRDLLWNVLGVLVLIAVALSWVHGYRVNQCQAEANRQFSAGLAERSEAAAVERQANRIERDAWRSAIRGTPSTASPPEKAAAAKRITDALDEADRLVAEADARRAAAPQLDVGARDCG